MPRLHRNDHLLNILTDYTDLFISFQLPVLHKHLFKGLRVLSIMLYHLITSLDKLSVILLNSGWYQFFRRVRRAR